MARAAPLVLALLAAASCRSDGRQPADSALPPEDPAPASVVIASVPDRIALEPEVVDVPDVSCTTVYVPKETVGSDPERAPEDEILFGESAGETEPMVECFAAGLTSSVSAPDAAAPVQQPARPGLTREQERHPVRAVVREHLQEIHGCCLEGLRRFADVHGWLILELTFDTAGKLQTSAIVSSSLADAGVGECVMAHARKWSFPAMTETLVTLPLVLAAPRRPLPLPPQ